MDGREFRHALNLLIAKATSRTGVAGA